MLRWGGGNKNWGEMGGLRGHPDTHLRQPGKHQTLHVASALQEGREQRVTETPPKKKRGGAPPRGEKGWEMG